MKKTAKPSTALLRKVKVANKTAKRSKSVAVTKASDADVIVIHVPPAETDAFVEAGLKMERASRNRPAPKFTARIKDGTFDSELVPDYSVSHPEWVAGVNAAGGAASNVSATAVALIASFAVDAYGSALKGVRACNEMIAAAVEIAPRDALEGMLVSQMVTTYHQSMLCAGRAAAAKQILQGTYHHNQATRLQRLFLLQLDALNKHRGKGPSEQKVTVEHVHVHAGGQAIVGANVKRTGEAPEGEGINYEG